MSIATHYNTSNLILRRRAVPGAEIHVREGAGEEAGRTICGHAILFGSFSLPFLSNDREEIREVIERGAVPPELLDRSDIKFTMYHDRQILLGRSVNGAGTLRYSIDEKGVAFELELPKSPNGDEALELVRRGDITGCSFAFSLPDYSDPEYVEKEVTREEGKKITTFRVKKITGIHDFTLAADPAYPATDVEARELLALPGEAPAAAVREMRAAVERMKRMI